MIDLLEAGGYSSGCTSFPKSQTQGRKITIVLGELSAGTLYLEVQKVLGKASM